MDDSLFLGLPLPVALALAAFVPGLLGLAWVLVSLGKPAPLRIAGNGDSLHPAEDRDGAGIDPSGAPRQAVQGLAAPLTQP